VGVTLRPRKVLYVTAGLRGGGAEAMLARLASAQPGVADDITIVSLLPAEAHMERLRAGRRHGRRAAVRQSWRHCGGPV